MKSKNRFFFLLIVLLLLLVSCDVTNVPNKITSKTDYNLSREIVFEKTLTKDEMKNIVSEALNKIAEVRGYQTKVFIQKTKDTSYGKAYSANVEEIVYSDEKYYQGYIKEVNIDNDGETVEYFCKDDKEYYYNHTTGTKDRREDSYFTTYLSINMIEFLEDLEYRDYDKYGVDDKGNSIYISYVTVAEKSYEMRLIFNNNKLIHYAYAWRDYTNKYFDIFYEDYNNIEINYPDFKEYD